MPGRRRGNIFLEVVVAFALFAAMLIPLLSGYGTGVEQTRLIKSHASARYLAEWALAVSRSLVAEGFYEGLACPADGAPLLSENLTAEARGRFSGVAAPLHDLSLTRTTRCLDVGGVASPRLYRLDVEVRWRDGGPDAPEKQLSVRAIEGEEL